MRLGFPDLTVIVIAPAPGARVQGLGSEMSRAYVSPRSSLECMLCSAELVECLVGLSLADSL